MDNKSIRVLLVEESAFATQHTKKMLAEAASSEFSVELECADQMSVGLERLSKGGIDMVLLDLTLQDTDGLETFQKVHSFTSEIPIVVMSGLDDEKLAIEAVQQGAQDYLVKGRVDGNLLKRSILYAMERQKAEKRIQKLNRELEQRLEELRATNEELEAFSYSVSHDLRAPLRAVDGFSRVLSEDYGEKLGGEGKRLLGMVRDGTKRMGQLIEDILALSRLGRKKIKKNRIKMEKLTSNVLDGIKASDPEEKARFEIKELPPSFGDETLVLEILTNLISNAVKFSRNENTPVVEVGGKEGDGENTYYVKDNVKDNGVGFDMKYVSKAFHVFQRLHSDEEFEGTGVGLAIVQRIVHRHGGRVWAEGKVGKGATFYFALPSRKEE